MLKQLYLVKLVVINFKKKKIYIYQELIIVVRESIQHAIGMCKMSA